MKEFTIRGVNIEQGIKFSAAGNYTNYVRILETFHKEVKEKLELLTKCVEERDFSLYTIHIHAVKSACASIGANEVSQLAEALEMLGKNGEFDIIKISHNDFAKDATTLLEDIQQVIKDRAADVQKKFNNSEIVEKLEALRRALEDYDITLIDQLSDDLQSYTNHPTLGTPIGEILHNAFITSYDKAMKQIDEML